MGEGDGYDRGILECHKHPVHNNFFLPQSNLEVKYWDLYILCCKKKKKKREGSSWVFPKHPLLPCISMWEKQPMLIARTRYQTLCCMHWVHYPHEQHPLLLKDFTQASLPLCTLSLTSSFITELTPPYFVLPLAPLTLPLWSCVTYIGVPFCPFSRPACPKWKPLVTGATEHLQCVRSNLRSAVLKYTPDFEVLVWKMQCKMSH